MEFSFCGLICAECRRLKLLLGPEVIARVAIRRTSAVRGAHEM